MNLLTKTLGIGALLLVGFSPVKAQNNISSINPDSCFNVALASEQFFRSERDTIYAGIAIENYDKYYKADPTGKHACDALIRKVNLLNDIGRNEEAMAELNRVKNSSKCMDIYSNMVKYIENTLKRREE